MLGFFGSGGTCVVRTPSSPVLFSVILVSPRVTVSGKPPLFSPVFVLTTKASSSVLVCLTTTPSSEMTRAVIERFPRARASIR